MTPHLVFTLSATLAAMGDLAGHERRGTLTWPGRSAVLGLSGAALGFRRGDDFAALDALSVAVAVFDDGSSLRDYHTVQTVPSAAARRPNSRPEAMRKAGPQRLNTTITLRDYRTGVLYGVAMAGDADLLERLCAALAQPVFTLYLGRKACPLSAPLAPVLTQAEGPEQAMAALRLPPWHARDRRGAPLVARTLYADAGPGDVQVEQRHDQPRDRGLWHFAPRRVSVRQVAIVGQGAAP